MKRNHKNHLDLPTDFSLESLRDQNPFRVPDGYFDELPHLINERIETKTMIRRSRRIHPGVFAAAASVVVLLGLALVMRTSIVDSSSSMQLSSVQTNHIVKHLDSAIINGEMDEPILMEAVINSTNQNSTSKSSSASKQQVQEEATGILPTVSDEDIIEYLIQDNATLNTNSDLMQ